MNRLCGSGFQSIVNGAQDIILGAAKISLTGGVDNMSQSPFVVRNIRFGAGLGVPHVFEDTLWVNDSIFLLRCIETIGKTFLLELLKLGWFDRFLLQSTDGHHS